MNTELQITTERIDDFVLLLEVMMRLNLPTILDRHLPRHWLQQGLSWGWVSTIWLAHIISQGDHRKLPVRAWVGQAHRTLEKVTGLSIRETDFTDDRLTIVLRELSKPSYWYAIEHELGQQTIRVYDLEPETVRVDATTVSGYHTVGEAGLFQFGKSKDNPDLPQIKVMQGALDPLGLPLATDVVSGEQADDGLYVPIIARMLTILTKSGLLFVGDCKLSALGSRAYLQERDQFYLSPLALVGETATEMAGWIQAALEGPQSLTDIYGRDEGDQPVLLGQGYETSRLCSAQVGGQTVTWTERVLVVHSQAYAEAMGRGLEQRLAKTTAKLQALTPPRGRGKRQISQETDLTQAAEAIVQAHRVAGLVSYTFERQAEHIVKFVGRGRGGEERAKRVIERVRYQITAVIRQEPAITALKRTFGWRAYASNAPAEKLTLETAVLTYRAEWLIERGFHRLKGAPLSLTPLLVKRDDQVVGLTHLLSLADRILTLIEFVVRRSLKQAQTTLVGLYPQNPKQATASPTTERLLQAFANITLTIIQFPDRTLRVHHLTPLTALQVQILELLDLSPDLYRSLAENST
jgi:transposase